MFQVELFWQQLTFHDNRLFTYKFNSSHNVTSHDDSGDSPITVLILQ